jgi:hypothetical protein
LMAEDGVYAEMYSVSEAPPEPKPAD